MAKLRKLMLNCWVLSEILSPQVKTPQHLSQPWQPETTSSEATSNRMPINFWCVCWISWVRTWNSTIKHPRFAPVPNRSFNEYNSLLLRAKPLGSYTCPVSTRTSTRTSADNTSHQYIASPAESLWTALIRSGMCSWHSARTEPRMTWLRWWTGSPWRRI